MKQISKRILGIIAILLLGGFVYKFVYSPKSEVQSIKQELFKNLEKHQIDLEDAPSITILEIGKKNYSNYIIIGILIIIVLLLSYIIYQHQKANMPDSFVQLTQKESEIVRYIQAGKTNQEIADELFISVSTVKTHVNNIYKKLHIKSRKELITQVLTKK